MTRSLLKGKNVPRVFWGVGEAVTLAVYLFNWTTRRSLKNKTLYETFYKRKPNVLDLRIFGCVAHVKIATPNLNKMEVESTLVVFIEYETWSKAYRFYNPKNQKVYIRRDVVFKEGKGWSWNTHTDEKHSDTFKIQFQTLQGSGEEQGVADEVAIFRKSQFW